MGANAQMPEHLSPALARCRGIATYDASRPQPLDDANTAQAQIFEAVESHLNSPWSHHKCHPSCVWCIQRVTSVTGRMVAASLAAAYAHLAWQRT